jgi:hypothetical protein
LISDHFSLRFKKQCPAILQRRLSVWKDYLTRSGNDTHNVYATALC